MESKGNCHSTYIHERKHLVLRMVNHKQKEVVSAFHDKDKALECVSENKRDGYFYEKLNINSSGFKIIQRK